MVSLINKTPMTARVYVNLPEGTNKTIGIIVYYTTTKDPTHQTIPDLKNDQWRLFWGISNFPAKV